MKLNRNGLFVVLILTSLLSACGGKKSCNSDDVVGDIKQIVLNSIQSMRFAEGQGVQSRVDMARADINEVSVSDVFNFHRYDDGSLTCKAKITVKDALATHSREMNYEVRNYEDGFKVLVDRGDVNLLANEIVGGLIRKAQQEEFEMLLVKAKEKKAALEAFNNRSLKGNVCGDHMDQDAFMKQFVDLSSRELTAEYEPEFADRARSIVASNPVRIVDVVTKYSLPTNEDDLEHSTTFYECEASFAVTMPDGSVVTRGFGGFRAESLGSQFIGYRRSYDDDQEKYDLTNLVLQISYKLKYNR